MKKILIIMIALALVLSMAGFVSAGEIDVSTKGTHTSGPNQVTGETYISYGVTSGYTLVIPNSFDFTEVNTIAKSKVNATEVRLATNEILNVTVKSTHGWNLVEHAEDPNDENVLVEVPSGASLKYEMSFTDQSSGSQIISSENTDKEVKVSVLVVNSGSSTGETVLTFTLIDTTNAKAATYMDKLTFHASIENTS